MAPREEGKAPDPLGKRALYWAPSPADGSEEPGDPVPPTTVLPAGKRALYSGASAEGESAIPTSDNPLIGRGTFTVRCQRCRQQSRVGLLDLLIFQFPVGVWVPRGRFDHRMTCPSCRKRAWCSVTLRRH
jgi:hypothetical protein